MTTIRNNKLPEWRKTLNKSVENYQSMRAWYEENPDNPSAEQDMDAAAGEIEKLIKQYGVLIVLNLLDEIDELQERRKADSAEPACYALTNMAGEVYNTHSSAQNAGAYRDLIHQSDDSLTLRVTPLYTVPPAPVVPEGLVKAVRFYEQVKRENPPVETGAWKDAVDWVLKEACKAVSMLESSREHEVISQQEKA
ncbi:TPA: hypothetical protein ACU8LT_003055 [Salmonella enterica]